MRLRHFMFAIVVFCVLIAGVYALLYGVCYTTTGSTVLTKLALRFYTGSGAIAIGAIEGSLARGLRFGDIRLSALSRLPADTEIRIQQLDARVASIGFPWIHAQVQNGRILFPGSETILFYGVLEKGDLDLSLFSKMLGVQEILHLFTDSAMLKNITGRIADVDLRVSGHLLRPRVEGTFYIDVLAHETFTFHQCPGSVDLQIAAGGQLPNIYGYIAVSRGRYLSGRSEFELSPSKIRYNGDPRQPQLECRGTTRINTVEITVTLEGLVDTPTVTLASSPPYRQEELMVMLATGTAWSGTREALQHGQISADVLKDFVDYLLFSGQGSQFARYLGLDKISLRYDRQTRGIMVEKAVANNTSLRYGLEQKQSNVDPLTTTHTVGGTYAVSQTSSIAIEAEREFEVLAPDQPPEKTDDKVMLKFLQKF